MITADGHIFRHLDTNGDGTGTKNANGNYASAAEDFYFEASAECEIHRMLIKIGDTAGMAANEYGNGVAITNGVEALVEDGSGNQLLDLVDGINVLNNADWGRLCYDADLKSWSTGPEFLLVRWTFSRAGRPLRLSPGHRLIIRLNDDFTGLIDHYFLIQGVRV